MGVRLPRREAGGAPQETRAPCPTGRFRQTLPARKVTGQPTGDGAGGCVLGPIFAVRRNERKKKISEVRPTAEFRPLPLVELLYHNIRT